MRSRRIFRPSSVQTMELEERMVLNGSHTKQVASSILLQGLNASARALRPHSAAAVSSLVDLSYQSFQQDYRAIRATYLSAVQNGTATAADKSALTTATQQRVNLLAQQVTNSLLQYNAGTTRGHSTDSPLPLIIKSINGATDSKNANPRQAAGTLVKNLTESIPDPGASVTTISLTTISQDNAIQASRASTLNAVTIIRNGNFGNGSKH